MTEIKPCPLCDVALFHNGASELGDIYDHPLNGCAIQVAWFTATPDWVEKWNRRPSTSISEGEVEALIAEAADFTERMTGQPWACELIDRLASILAASKARSTTEVEVKAPELANELWEALFNITKDAVPEELTDAVLTVIAERLLTGYSITRNPPPRTP